LSKDTFHAHLLSDSAEAKKVFPNTPKGFEQLTTWLKNRHAGEVHFCMEATGSYWEALALYLHGLDQHVSVVNPARIKALRRASCCGRRPTRLTRNSSRASVRVRAPSHGSPPAPEIRVLQALMRHCDHLKKTRAQQSVYAQSSDRPSLRPRFGRSSPRSTNRSRRLSGRFASTSMIIPDLKRRRDFTDVDSWNWRDNSRVHPFGDPASRSL